MSDERRFWETADDDDLHGVPAYDHEVVATRLELNSGLGFEQPARILDVGCGRGRLTNHIAEQHPNWSVIGFDIARDKIASAIAGAPPTNNTHYRLGDGRRLPTNIGESFDFAYSVTVLQHVHDDEKAGYINQVINRLKSGASFAFTLAINNDPPSPFNYPMSPDAAGDMLGGLCAGRCSGWIMNLEPDARGWHWVTITRRTENA